MQSLTGVVVLDMQDLAHFLCKEIPIRGQGSSNLEM